MGQRYDAYSPEAEHNVPYLVLREASLEEFLAQENVTDRERRLLATGEVRYFYEVSVD